MLDSISKEWIIKGLSERVTEIENPVILVDGVHGVHNVRSIHIVDESMVCNFTIDDMGWNFTSEYYLKGFTRHIKLWHCLPYMGDGSGDEAYKVTKDDDPDFIDLCLNAIQLARL